MKKHIFKSIIAIAASIFFVPALSAQNIAEPYVENESAQVAFKKSVTQTPNEKGEYIIKLEAFATGTMTVTNDAKPADVILILDVSGSMNQTYTTYTYSPRNQPSNGYVYSRSYDNHYALFTDGKYYPVQKDYEWDIVWDWLNSHIEYEYYLYIQVNGVTYYLSDTSFVIDQPTNYGAQNVAIWNGTLYSRSSQTFNKLAKLKESVNAFIDIIDKNDEYSDYPTCHVKRTNPVTGAEERLGNTMAIIPFAANATTSGDYADFLPLTRRSDLESLVSRLTADGGTYVEKATAIAKTMMSGLGDDRKNRTVIIFTDGIPGNGNWEHTSATTSANGAIKDANDIKKLADQQKHINSTVFTIGLFDSPNTQTDTYMAKTSSDYKDATTMDNGTRLTNGKYYKKAGEGAEDLAEIFRSIAEVSGGTSSPIGSSASTSIDVVSTSFNIPTGADHSQVEIWTAPVVGEGVYSGNGQTYLTFGAEVKKGSTGAGVLDNTELVPDTTNPNLVKVTGFDFAGNWCGYESTTQTAHGWKLILKIPIMINEDATGGPAVDTNTDESGIYLEGSTEPLIHFNKPTVKIPVNLWILKAGLEEDETARFTIERKDTRVSGSDYVDFMTVTLVGGKDEVTRTFIDKNGIEQTFTGPMKKILGLDPNYHYQIKEQNWSWTYSNQEMTPMTTEGLTVNPFVIKNTKGDPEVKNSESMIRNEFTVKKTATTTTVIVTP